MQSTLIIGAGLAGLLAARTLQAAGVAVTVLDKARGVGGRLATRRLTDANGQMIGRFDHGAQYFTARDPRFMALVEDWLAAGVIKVWAEGFNTPAGPKPDNLTRYCGPNGMNGLAKHLAQGLTIQTSTPVAAIWQTDSGYRATTADGQSFSADSLILTPASRTNAGPAGGRRSPAGARCPGRAKHHPICPLLRRPGPVGRPLANPGAGRPLAQRRHSFLAGRQCPERDFRHTDYHHPRHTRVHRSPFRAGSGRSGAQINRGRCALAGQPGCRLPGPPLALQHPDPNAPRALPLVTAISAPPGRRRRLRWPPCGGGGPIWAGCGGSAFIVPPARRAGICRPDFLRVPFLPPENSVTNRGNSANSIPHALNLHASFTTHRATIRSK